MNSEEWLKGLRQMFIGTEDLIAPTIQDFLEESEEFLAQIDVAVETKNHEAVARGAHKLRGCASQVHAQAIVDLTTHLEENATHLTTDQQKESCQKMRAELGQVHDVLKKIQKSLDSLTQ